MKYKVLVTAPYLQPVINDYREIFDKNGAELIIPKVNERLTERVLSQAPRLKVISKWGTGIDSIDKEAAAKLGIAVRNTPNAFSEPVADTVFSFMLCFARKTLELNEKMKQNIWIKEPSYALQECVLGVIGLGNIGKAVIKRAQAFGMRVLGNDIKEMPFDFMVSLEKLLKESDFVSLNCDLNPSSRHLINRERLALMKPTAYLINTSRGPVIDEEALAEALENKKIAGAGLDVFEEEPLPQGSPLRKFPNVILSPHNANSGIAAWKKVHENTIKNAIEELNKHINEA